MFVNKKNKAVDSVALFQALDSYGSYFNHKTVYTVPLKYRKRKWRNFSFKSLFIRKK